MDTLTQKVAGPECPLARLTIGKLDCETMSLEMGKIVSNQPPDHFEQVFPNGERAFSALTAFPYGER